MTDITPPTPPLPPQAPAKQQQAPAQQKDILADAPHAPLDKSKVAVAEGRQPADERARAQSPDAKYYVAEGGSVNVPVVEDSGAVLMRSAYPGDLIWAKEDVGDDTSDLDGWVLPRKRIAQLIASGFVKLIGHDEDSIDAKLRADQESMTVRRRLVQRRSRFAYDPEFLLGKTYDDLVALILNASKGNMSPPATKEECIQILSEDFGKQPTAPDATK